LVGKTELRAALVLGGVGAMQTTLAGIGMGMDFGWNQNADSIRAVVVVVADNHCFGKGRTGTVAAREDIHSAAALDDLDTIGPHDSGYTVDIASWQEQL